MQHRLSLAIDPSGMVTGSRVVRKSLKDVGDVAVRTEDRVERVGTASGVAASGLSRIKPAAGTAVAGLSNVGTGANGAVAALNRMNTALAANSAAMSMNAGKSKNAAFQQRQVALQMGDVFQTLALGQNPMTVALQQGPQLAQIYGPGEGGVGRAFKESAKMMGGLLTKFPLLTGAAAALGVGFAGLRHEINKTSETSVSWGNVMSATYDVVSSRLYTLVKPAVEAVSGWVEKGWDIALDLTKRSANSMIAMFVGAYNAVRNTWSLLPEAMGDIAITTANNVIKAIEDMVNRSSSVINAFTEKVNKYAPASMQIGEIGKVKLGGLENGFDGAAGSVKQAVTDAFQSAASEDYLGGLFSDIRIKAIEKAKAAIDGVKTKTNEAKDALTQAGETSKMAWESVKSGAKSAADATNEMMNTAKNAAVGFFKEIRTGLSEGKGLWKSFGDAAINALTKIADKLLEQAIANFVASLFGGGQMFGPGAGDPWGGMRSVGVFHSGGVVTAMNDNAPSRAVDMSVFRGAPRKHSGMGLAPDERPIIAQTGEVVLSREQVSAARQSGTGPQPMHITVGVSADNNGNLTPFVEQVARGQAARVVQAAAPSIVSHAEAQTIRSIGTGKADAAMSGRYVATPKANRR
ncbi:MAG: phage tail length tape measure family protein [Pseudomonadota bacterium]